MIFEIKVVVDEIHSFRNRKVLNSFEVWMENMSSICEGVEVSLHDNNQG